MRKIVYYVATSLDGFIAGPNEEVDKFIAGGDAVEHYLNDLQTFDTVIMGRKTYEFGYKFGLQPGAAPYPHMQNYIFSETLKLDNAEKRVHVVEPDLELIKKIKKEEGTDIYLCGGGQFAGWLLDHQLIDVLKVKLNPILLGAGVPMFGESKTALFLDLREKLDFEGGLMVLTYDVRYK